MEVLGWTEEVGEKYLYLCFKKGREVKLSRGLFEPSQDDLVENYEERHTTRQLSGRAFFLDTWGNPLNFFDIPPFPHGKPTPHWIISQELRIVEGVLVWDVGMETIAGKKYNLPTERFGDKYRRYYYPWEKTVRMVVSTNGDFHTLNQYHTHPEYEVFSVTHSVLGISVQKKCKTGRIKYHRPEGYWSCYVRISLNKYSSMEIPEGSELDRAPSGYYDERL